MMLIVGLFFVALGFLCGGALLVSPFSWAIAAGGLATYLLFPGLCILGYVFLIMGSRTETIVQATKFLSGALVMLSMAATTLLVIFATRILVPEGPTFALWYVLILGIVFGGAGLSLKSSETS